MARKTATTRTRSRRPGSVTSYQTKGGTRYPLPTVGAR